MPCEVERKGSCGDQYQNDQQDLYEWQPTTLLLLTFVWRLVESCFGVQYGELPIQSCYYPAR